MSKVTLYKNLKKTLSGKEVQLLYSLLYTTKNSYFESKFNLTNLDWDRHALFLLQNYYGIDNRSFYQLFEEYTLDFFSPPGNEIQKEKFQDYLEYLQNNATGNESDTQINSREILKQVWDESFSGTTVQKNVSYPSPGKVFLNRLIFIAKHSVREQSQFPPPGFKRIASRQRTKYFVNRMESIAKFWKAAQSTHAIMKGTDRQNSLSALRFKNVLDDFHDSKENDDLDTFVEESARNKVSFYTTPTQVKIRAFIMDMMKISSPNELLKTFVARLNSGKKKSLSEEDIQLLSSIELESFDELEEVLSILLSGEREIPLRLQKDDRIVFKRASGSLLKSYMRCPWVFTFRYLFKLRFPDTSGSYSGNVLHDAQDKYQRLIKEAVEKGEEVSHSAIRLQATTEAIETMQEKAKTATAAVQKQIKDSKEKLQKNISSIFEKETSFEKEQNKLLEEGKIKRLPEILTEQVISVDFEGIKLVGSIDRLERHFPTDGKEYVVLSEFKSSLHSKARPETHHQLMIYAIAYEILHGEIPNKIALETPKMRMEFTVTEAWLNHAKKYIRDSVKQLNSSTIVAKPMKSNCSSCEARSICPSSFHLFFSELSSLKKSMEKEISVNNNDATVTTLVQEIASKNGSHNDSSLSAIMNTNSDYHASSQKENKSQNLKERNDPKNGKGNRDKSTTKKKEKNADKSKSSENHNPSNHTKPNQQEASKSQKNSDDINAQNSEMRVKKLQKLTKAASMKSEIPSPNKNTKQRKTSMQTSESNPSKLSSKSQENGTTQHPEKSEKQSTSSHIAHDKTDKRNIANAHFDDSQVQDTSINYNTSQIEKPDEDPHIINSNHVSKNKNIPPMATKNLTNMKSKDDFTQFNRYMPSKPQIDQPNAIEIIPVQVEDILYQVEKPVPRPNRMPFTPKHQNVLELMHDFLNKLERGK